MKEFCLIIILFFSTYYLLEFIRFNIVMDKLEKIPGYTLILERRFIIIEYSGKRIKSYFAKRKFKYAQYIEDNFIWGIRGK